MSQFKITKATDTRINDIDYNNLGFGKYFSDHMFVTKFSDGKWDEGEIKPYGKIEIEPAMCTLHYGQALFEGLKAFRSAKGGVNLFRPEKNGERMNNSAERICIPTYDIDTMIDAISELVKIDINFIPKERGHSLYIRPVMFGDGNFLGVHASDTYQLIIMTGPVSSYYPEGIKPVKIMVCDEYVRAAKGGTGYAKVAGNYAASLLAGKKAQAAGFSQVLWLDAIHREYVDEVGAMNIMFVIGDELITPTLENGTILPGVTRNSVLTLAKEWGMKVSERPLSINEITSVSSDGTLKECFGTGTAAVISPVGLLNYKGEEIIVNNQKIGPVAQKLYDTLTGVQYGEIEDTRGWITHIDV